MVLGQSHPLAGSCFICNAIQCFSSMEISYRMQGKTQWSLEVTFIIHQGIKSHSICKFFGGVQAKAYKVKKVTFIPIPMTGPLRLAATPASSWDRAVFHFGRIQTCCYFWVIIVLTYFKQGWSPTHIRPGCGGGGTFLNSTKSWVC